MPVPDPNLIAAFKTAHFTIFRDRQVLNRIVYNAEFLYKRIRTTTGLEAPFHEIIPNRVYLGRQPTATTQNPIRSRIINPDSQEPRGLTVAVIEPFEMQGSLHKDVLRPEDWLYENVRHHLLPMKDHQGDVAIDQTLMTIYLMYEFMQKNIPIYIHCKAGVGRSAMLSLLLICYMYIKGEELPKKLLQHYLPQELRGNTVDWNDDNLQLLLKNTIQFLRVLRPEINLNTNQVNATESLLLALAAEVKKKSDNVESRSENYQFLHGLAQSVAFKEMKCHLAGVYNCHSQRAQSVQAFLDRVLNNDLSWVQECENCCLKEHAVVGTLGHYGYADTHTEKDTEARNVIRRQHLTLLQQDIKRLVKQNPESDYAILYVAQTERLKPQTVNDDDAYLSFGN